MARTARHWGAATALFALLAWLQLFVFVDGKSFGRWFLFGTDTIYHDAIVHLWVQQRHAAAPLEIPLWIPELQGGLPTVGAFLWTPLAPPLWPYLVFEWPAASKLAWWLTLLWAGQGAFAAARVLRMNWWCAALAGVCWMLSGHLVTLIHAGHLQKVMALAWAGWAVAGAVALSRQVQGGRLAGRNRTQALCGAGAGAGISIGGMFLCGHPQIAYAFAAVVGVWACIGVRSIAGARRAAIGLAAFGIVSGLVAGAQLLPGLEMARHSNRSGGVPMEEAAATSYPPMELLEFVAPRFLGSKTPADEARYVGAWGERIVSDYAGALTVVLALGAFSNARRRRIAVLLAGFAVAALLVGLGKYTPLFGLLREVLPGFASFRSPATFFCVASLAIALMAALGLERAMRADRRTVLWIFGSVLAVAGLAAVAYAQRLEKFPLYSGESAPRYFHWVLLLSVAMMPLLLLPYVKPRPPRWAVAGGAALVVAVCAVDLLRANRAFLRVADWDPFAQYLAPNDVEAALRIDAGDGPLRIAYPENEYALRTVLFGIDALNGYHPIGFGVKERSDAALALHSDAWRAQWGVAATLRRDGSGLFRRIERSPAEQSQTLRGLLPGDTATWLRTESPNERAIQVSLAEARTIEAAELDAPGWRLLVNGEERDASRPLPQLTRRVALPAGAHEVRWRYEPPAWRIGVWMTALGLGLAAFLLGTGRRIPAGTTRT